MFVIYQYAIITIFFKLKWKKPQMFILSYVFPLYICMYTLWNANHCFVDYRERYVYWLYQFFLFIKKSVALMKALPRCIHVTFSLTLDEHLKIFCVHRIAWPIISIIKCDVRSLMLCARCFCWKFSITQFVRLCCFSFHWNYIDFSLTKIETNLIY